MSDLMTYLERRWWLLLVRGIAAILFGVAAFIWPGLTVLLLMLLFGSWVLVDGVFAIVDSIRYRDRIDKWWLWLLDGVLSLVVGGLMLLMPGATALALLVILAAWAIVGGIFRIVAAIQLRKRIEGEWLLGLNGVLSILVGVLLFVAPGAGVLSLVWLIGLWAVVFGVLFIMLAFRLRKAGRERSA